MAITILFNTSGIWSMQNYTICFTGQLQVLCNEDNQFIMSVIFLQIVKILQHILQPSNLLT